MPGVVRNAGSRSWRRQPDKPFPVLLFAPILKFESSVDRENPLTTEDTEGTEAVYIDDPTEI